MIKWLMIILLLSSTVLAYNDVDAGILPDGALWKLDIAWEHFMVWITPGEFEKEKILVKNLQERIAELEEVELDEETLFKLEMEKEMILGRIEMLDVEPYKKDYSAILIEKSKVTESKVKAQIDYLIKEEQTPVIDLV